MSVLDGLQGSRSREELGTPRRHILLLVPSLGGGGAERVIATLAKHLDRSRFRLTLAVVDLRNAVFRDEIPHDVEIVDLRAVRVRSALPRIVALVWRLKPNVLFSTLGHLNLALAIIRFLLPLHVRTIARETIVVSYGLGRYRFRAAWAALYRLFYRRHDQVVCQSRDMRDDLVAHFGFPREKTVVIHNPVDVRYIRELGRQSANLPATPARSIRLVAAGRLEYQKGFDLLIEALARLNNSAVHLMLLGRGPLEGDLKQQAVTSGLVDRIHFVGFQANPYAWFTRCDAFVLSSRYEGFPNVVLEAMTCGTPVVAMPAPGGTLEILGNAEGCVLAEAVSSSALARAMQTWLDGPRRRIDETAVESYRLEQIIGEYEAILCNRPRT